MPNRMGSGVYTENVTTNRNKHTKHSVCHGDSITVSTSPHYPSEIEESEAQTKKISVESNPKVYKQTAPDLTQDFEPGLFIRRETDCLTTDLSP